MKKLARLFGSVFLVVGTVMIIVCTGCLMIIIETGFSPTIISFFELEMTSVIRYLAISAVTSGIMWIFTSRCPLDCQGGAK